MRIIFAFLILLHFFIGNVFAAQSIQVAARPLAELLVSHELRAPATVISANRAVVTSQVTATVDSVLADVGAEVSKNELLIRLDDDNARLALAQANAELAAVDARIIEAQSKLKNAEELLLKNFISDEELQSRIASLAVFRANRSSQLVAVDRARLDLSRTEIRAPFDASIVERQAQVGNYAQPGTPLITLVQTAEREIDVELDPRYALDITDASDQRFESRGNVWQVELARLSNVIDATSRVVYARFHFVADVAPIGSSGHVVWSQGSRLIPVEYIVQRGMSLGVFVADSGRARFFPIALAQEGRPARTELPLDTLVIYRGHFRLQDGDDITVSAQ